METKTIHQNGFLLANDAPVAAYMTKGTISVNYLQDYLETYAAKKKVKDVLLIVDACRAGKLAGGTEGIQITMHALGETWNNQIIKILSAQEGESSFEDKKWGDGRGVFSYYLVKGLEGLANRNADSVITTAELAAYLPFAVADATSSVQNPTISGNPKTTLFSFNKQLLALANQQDTQAGSGQVLASRGTNDELDPQIKQWYDQYRTYLQKGRLIWGKKQTDTINCAKFYYLKLVKDARAKTLLPSLKSSFISSLKHKTELKLDDYIKGNGFDDEEDEAYKEMLYAKSQIDSSYILYNYFAARLYFMEGYKTENPLNAIKLLKKVVQIEPDAAYAFNKLGQIFYEKFSKGDSAVYYYNRAISLSPTWAYTFDRLSYHYYLINDYKKAIFYERKAISIDSLNMDFYFSLADYYKTTKNERVADSVYKIAVDAGKNQIKKDSTKAQPYNRLAYYFFSQKDYNEAIKYINKAISIDKNNGILYQHRGVIFLRENNSDEAIKSLAIAVKLVPKISEALFSIMGEAYIGKNYYNNAIKNYREAIDSYPKNIGFYISLSNTLILVKKNKQADETCRAALTAVEQQPAIPDLELSYRFRDIGNIFNKIGDTIKAKESYNMAVENYNYLIKNNPRVTGAYEELIDFYDGIKDYQNAEKVCNTAISLFPQNGEVYYELACVFANEKNPEQGMKYLTIAFEKGVFGDYDRFNTDPDLVNLRELPEFKELMKKRFPDKVK